MDISIRNSKVEDAGALAISAAKLFHQTYVGQMPVQDLEMYIADDFSREQQLQELENAAITTLIAEVDGKLIGYAQLRNKPVPVTNNYESSVELWRIYLDKAFQGKGVGRQLLSRVGEAARSISSENIWLGVWERNQKAISFYESCGFVAVGIQEFKIGSEIHNDIVMIGSTNAF